jgi:hypothetical protein
MVRHLAVIWRVPRGDITSRYDAQKMENVEMAGFC